jgi:hypothetical protein
MALDAAHRSSIYQKLVPLLGDDDANALLTQFPSIEAEELVTKDFLRAELALTRADLRAEMATMGAELRAEMGTMRDELRGEMAALRDELRDEMGAVRTHTDGSVAGLRVDMAELQSTLTLRLGGAIAAATALLGGLGLLT